MNKFLELTTEDDDPITINIETIVMIVPLDKNTDPGSYITLRDLVSGKNYPITVLESYEDVMRQLKAITPVEQSYIH